MSDDKVRGVELTDAQVQAICDRLPWFDIPLGEMKDALRAVGIYTADLPDGTIPGSPRVEPDGVSRRIREKWEQEQAAGARHDD